MDLEEDDILDNKIDVDTERQVQDDTVVDYIKRVKTIQLFVFGAFSIAGLGAWIIYSEVLKRFYRLGLSFWTEMNRYRLEEGVAFIGATIVIITATVTTFLLLKSGLRYRKFLIDRQQTATYLDAQRYNTLFWKAFLIPAAICSIFTLYLFITEFSRYFLGYRFF